jgi:beta-phosphoglucomutase-like phosphatase (HAD superfamily)
MARIRAVLFDVDGTLLDSIDAHAHAWLDAFRGHGQNVAYELVRSKIGMADEQVLMQLTGIDPASVEGRSIVERREAMFRGHYLADLGPLPGARVLVDRVRSRGLACAAVGSAGRTELADLLREAAVADLLDVVVTPDEVESSGGADTMSVALDRLGVTPAEAVLVADTPFDVTSAERAGVACIAFRSGGWSDADLVGAVAIYDGPAELAARLDDSILARGLDEVQRTRASSMRLRRAVRRGA